MSGCLPSCWRAPLAESLDQGRAGTCNTNGRQVEGSARVAPEAFVPAQAPMRAGRVWRTRVRGQTQR